MSLTPAKAPRAEPGRSSGTGRRSPGRLLLAGVLVLGLAALLVMDGTRMVGRYMPFSVERNVAARYVPDLPRSDAYSDALNAFAEKIAAVQGLTPGIAVEVHVVRRNAIQAFATLGGHILVYEGLLRALRSEDELAAVIAHQIAHIAGRHAAEALGRRVSVGLMLSVVSQDWAESFAHPSFHASLRTAPSFTEEHEAAALTATGATLHSLYGHLGGAVDLSRTLQRLVAAQPGAELPILSAHPGLSLKEEALQQLSEERDWPLDEPQGKRRPLPSALTLPAPAGAPSPAVQPAPAPMTTPQS